MSNIMDFLKNIFGGSSGGANNFDRLVAAFEGQDDFLQRTVKSGENEFVVLFLDCMSDADNVGRFVLEPLTSAEKKLESAQEVADRAVSSIGAELVGDFETMQSKLLNGHSLVFLMPDKSRCASFDTRTSEGRSIAEPPTSGVTKGPREGFVESYKSNLTLLKKRLKTPDFKVKTVEVGKYTATSVAVCYIDSIADMKIVNEIYEKISQIDMDGIIDSSYVAKFLDNDKSGLFKMVGSCEKPDIVVAKLLEGRVAIVVDGSPIVLTLPYLFIEDMQSPEDYYDSPRTATLARWLRFFSVIMSILIPAIYVSLQNFNYQILPAKFLITIINATGAIPFRPLEEMIIVLLLFDILREANSRMPRFAGLSLSVVGAIVLGDAAIKAGLLGAPAVMIGALSGIGLYTMPDNTLLFSLLRLVLTLVGGLMGLYGLIIAGLMLLSYMIGLSDFGSPYLAPFAPSIEQDKKDALFKRDIYSLDKRPHSIRNTNKTRLKRGGAEK